MRIFKNEWIDRQMNFQSISWNEEKMIFLLLLLLKKCLDLNRRVLTKWLIKSSRTDVDVYWLCKINKCYSLLCICSCGTTIVVIDAVVRRFQSLYGMIVKKKRASNKKKRVRKSFFLKKFNANQQLKRYFRWQWSKFKKKKKRKNRTEQKKCQCSRRWKSLWNSYFVAVLSTIVFQYHCWRCLRHCHHLRRQISTK